MTTCILTGHVLNHLAELPSESVHCCVTSPPYYGLRDFGIEPQVWGGEVGCLHVWGDDGPSRRSTMDTGSGLTKGGKPRQGNNYEIMTGAFCRRCNAWRGSLGLEPTPALYVEHMVAVFRSVRRVLRKDGTLWLNIGDSYCNSDKWGGGGANTGKHTRKPDGTVASWEAVRRKLSRLPGIKPKDLIGIPWMLAFALRDDGWYLRSEITWAKRAPMPESVTDRPTSATEKVFLLTKSPRYFYDGDAVREPHEGPPVEHFGVVTAASKKISDDPKIRGKDFSIGKAREYNPAGRSMRNFWLLGPEPFPEAHFATFPSEIPRRAILAGCPKGGTVLDPFLGAGTTALVADRLGRNSIGIELNSAYAMMARRRIENDAGMFASFDDNSVNKTLDELAGEGAAWFPQNEKPRRVPILRG